MGGWEDEGMHGRVGALEDAMMVVIDVSMSAAFIMDPYAYIDTCIDAGCIAACIDVLQCMGMRADGWSHRVLLRAPHSVPQA